MQVMVVEIMRNTRFIAGKANIILTATKSKIKKGKNGRNTGKGRKVNGKKKKGNGLKIGAGQKKKDRNRKSG